MNTPEDYAEALEALEYRRATAQSGIECVDPLHGRAVRGRPAAGKNQGCVSRAAQRRHVLAASLRRLPRSCRCWWDASSALMEIVSWTATRVT